MSESSADGILLELVRAITELSWRAADRVEDGSAARLRALTVLDAPGPVNLTQFAAGLGAAASAASRLADRLIAAGLIHRDTADATRRQVHLRLTERGWAALNAYDRARLDCLRTGLAALPEAGRTAVLAALPMLSVAARGGPAGSDGHPAVQSATTLRLAGADDRQPRRPEREA